MKVAIATVQVPFISGGAEILADLLKQELVKRGHKAEIVTIPFKWYPWESLVNCMTMGRMIDLTEVNGEKIDCVIALKFPAYYLKHPNKVFWLLHQHRQAYDLWETPYGDLHLLENGKEIKQLIEKCDNKYIREAKRVFTIAQTTTDRLRKYNCIDSTVLYHPPINYEKLNCNGYGDYVFYPSRIDPIKRQRLLVEAAKYLKSKAKIIIAGGGSKAEIDYLKQYIQDNDLTDIVKLAGFISEEEKTKLYAECLAVYFGAYNEDYGYITLEGFFSKKPVIVHDDAGGPLEFVENEGNGFVIEPDAHRIAETIDRLYENRDEARRLGEKGRITLEEKHMDWDFVIDHLLGQSEVE